MLSQIEIKDNKNTSLNYLSKLSFFQNGKIIDFKPGINIIIGSNGCGKSTLLNLISEYTFCKEMYSKFYYEVLRFPKLWNEDNSVKNGILIKHDYKSSVFRLRPVSDYKRGEEQSNIDSFGLYAISKSRSVGEQTMTAVTSLIKILFGESKSEVNFEFILKDIENFKSRGINDLWNKRLDNLLEYYKENQINIKEEDFAWTILMDEPDRNLDINNLKNIYSILSYQKPKAQIIAVIHNPVLIYKLSKLSYVNFIEMKEGYLKQIKQFIEK